MVDFPPIVNDFDNLSLLYRNFTVEEDGIKGEQLPESLA
jgi:hypothetical protein